MAEAILVPQVGQDLTEAKIVALYVKVGDPVKKGDIVAEVESEKATFEVEAFSAGIVIDLTFAEGDVAAVLEPLMHVGQLGEAVAAEAGILAGKEPAAAAPSPSTGASAPASVAPAPAQGLGAAAVPPAVQRPLRAVVSTRSGQRASPVARRLAASAGLDLGSVVGSGPAGAVVLRDVQAQIAAGPVAVRLPQLNGATAVNLRTLQSGNGLPIVFLHGFGGDLSSWRGFLSRVSLDNPMIGVDLPAHGGSAWVAINRFEDLVDRIADALLGAGQHRLHLVGHSLGAAVATALADRGDLDVRSLTLIAPAGLGAKIDGEYVAGFLGANSEAALAAWMGRLVHDSASLPGALIRATLAARDGSDLAALQARAASVLFEGATQLFSIRDALARFDGPVRVIVGRSDAIIPASDTIAALPGHVAVHRLERNGHLPQLEAAALVGRLVTETIRSAG